MLRMSIPDKVRGHQQCYVLHSTRQNSLPSLSTLGRQHLRTEGMNGTLIVLTVSPALSGTFLTFALFGIRCSVPNFFMIQVT